MLLNKHNLSKWTNNWHNETGFVFFSKKIYKIKSHYKHIKAYMRLQLYVVSTKLSDKLFKILISSTIIGLWFSVYAKKYKHKFGTMCIHKPYTAFI
jgi:hypothetical protein